MELLLGIDLGTSGMKTILFDSAGDIVSSAYRGYELKQPEDGWAEQDPQDWWRAAKETISETINKSRCDSRDIKGIGISGQMHGMVMLDKKGAVLRDAILWCDGRSGRQCREIEEKLGRERLIELTANPAFPGFTASKILWAKEYQKSIYSSCDKILLPKDYIRYKLTGEIAQDVSDASGTNLLDINTRDWSDEVIEKLELKRTMFPVVRESTELGGIVTAEAAAETGLAEGTPVCMGAGDNAAAAVGTGVVAPGQALTSIGTSGVIFTCTDKLLVDKQARVHTFCHAVPGMWAFMSCTLAAGLSMSWFRDGFYAAEKQKAKKEGGSVYDIIEEQAASVAPGCDGLVYLPYLMGERSPVNDVSLRGAFSGISLSHSKKHFARAVMEGVSYSQRQCLEIIKDMSPKIDRMYLCGGGANSRLWAQMLADVYGHDLTVLHNTEGPALGAAILAGVCAGIYVSVDRACEQMISVREELHPLIQEGYEQGYQRYINTANRMS